MKTVIRNYKDDCVSILLSNSNGDSGFSDYEGACKRQRLFFEPNEEQLRAIVELESERCYICEYISIRKL
jgi:hypothetical protein